MKIQNSSELEFAIFCIENVAAKLGVNAECVYQAFTENDVYQLIRDGVSDMHCMSDEYPKELKLKALYIMDGTRIFMTS